MKSFVLFVCVLMLASSNSSELKRQLTDAMITVAMDIDTCATENELTDHDMYSEEDIMLNVHAEPGNEERTHKHGCMIACILKKQNLMEGTNIKETQVHTKLNSLMEDSPSLGIAHKIARKCMKQVRSITEECEKGFSLYTCVAKTVHKMSKHEEHVAEETEEETETNTETETETKTVTE